MVLRCGKHHEITKTSRALVEADAKSRAEFHELARDLQTERLGLNQQRESLDQEREELALARIRDPLIASAIVELGLAALCLLPLLVCIYVLRAVTSGNSEDGAQALSDLLVLDLTTQQPLLRLQSNTVSQEPGPPAAKPAALLLEKGG